MRDILARQKAAQLRDGSPPAALRIDRLNRCIDLLVTHEKDIIDALNADFGNRSPDMSRFTDVAAAIGRRYGIDPVVVRIALVVTTIFGGFGVPFYLLGWLFLPGESDEVS